MTTETSNARGEWVLVPRVPTKAMIDAWRDAPDIWEDAYAAMLAAAPQPPSEAQAQGDGEVVAYSEKFRASGDWSRYPIGTRAYDIQGGYWERVANGWKWCTGSTFPTPGGDAIYVAVPVRVPAPPSAPVGVDAPGSRAWMAEVCRAAALSLAAHGVRNDQLSKVADWIAQQPTAVAVDEAMVERAVAAVMSAPAGISVESYVRIVLEAALATKQQEPTT